MSSMRVRFLVTIVTLCLLPLDLFAWGETHVNENKSLLITDRTILNKIEHSGDFNLAVLLGEAGQFAQARRTDGNPRVTVGAFVKHVFNSAIWDQRDHTALPPYRKLGGDYELAGYDTTMGAVFDNWKKPWLLDGINNPNHLKDAPFRLIAIVNRIDKAGSYDDRGQTLAFAEPKALGELHLVFGLVDADYEAQFGEPFPMTFSLIYRLPATIWRHGKHVKDTRVSQFSLIKNQNIPLWKTKMEVWANRFQDLTEYGFHSAPFENITREVLGLAVQPENFVGFRSNTMINNSEFELREWYMSLNPKMLIRRKPENEPYGCLNNSNELTTIANHYWMGNQSNGYNDLDVTTITATQGSNKFSDDGLNGFTLPRLNHNWLLFNSNRSKKWTWSSCPQRRQDMPYTMFVGRPTIAQDTLFFLPNFGRIQGFGPIWKIKDANENKRHAVAIRTCTGCHSQEGATLGFHINPTLKNRRSVLSPYLTGDGLNKFTHGGETYRYDALKDRKNLLVKYIRRQGELFEGLKRSELVH